MKFNFLPTIICLVCIFFKIFPSFGQLTGTKYIPGDYATVSTAVTALNVGGVGAGGVTFNVAANYTDTIIVTISLTATGTAANPIVFQKDPATPGANPIMRAYTGGVGTPATAVQDGIWRLIGSDYVTIDGIDVMDNASNASNPSTMEYGYGLYKATATNGCQNNTIKNCTITLNRANNDVGTAPSVDGSVGINVTNALYTTATTAVTVTSAAGTNSNNKFYSNTISNCNTGIGLIGYAAVSPFTLADTGNDIGGSSLSTANTITNFGGGGILAIAVGIRTLAQYGVNVSYNTINSNDGGGVNHAFTLKGIWINTAISANTTVTYNTVTVKGAGTTQVTTAIENVSGTTAAANTVIISNNSIINCSNTAATTGSLFGIVNSGAPYTLNITNNTLYNTTYSSTTGLVYLIYNTGAATGAVNINNNNIGTPGMSAVTYNVANNAAQCSIYNSGGASTAAVSISNNIIQGINYATTGTGTYTVIYNSAASLSQAITSNIFTNLAVNISGNFTFISCSVVVSAGGTQTVNSNSISGTFTKAAGGTVTLFTSSATSAAGAITYNNNNNFSGITVTGATTIAGWANTDAGTSTKYIQNNTFTNWTGGTAAVTALSVSISGTVNGVSGNIINNITGAGSVTGIATGTGRDFIYSNTINTLTTTGAAGVIGISVSSGILKNIYKNKIYDLQASILGGNAYGISVSGTTLGPTTVNIYNNFIGDLRTPVASATDPVRGISITSTKSSSSINVYYNTIYLNASSTGANFGSTGIYHTASATSTTCNLTLNNNSVTNTSTPNGTGIAVAYRRSATANSNYNSSSGNNLFYAGAASITRLIFYNGTNKEQTIASYKARITPADDQSVTEDITAKYLSTTGSSALYLRMDPTKRTQIESGGINITGYTDDADADIRQGNTGYTGTGNAPDIGADEFEGIKFQALNGTYNVGVGQTYTSLTKADGLFSAINSVGLSGDVTVNVTSDLSEDGANSLFQWTETGAGNYDVTIQPNSATLRTISGDVLNGLMKFNGVGRVTIDGTYGGSGRYLTFTNTNTAGTTGTAFSFLNGATNNVIRYCKMEAYANATNSVILFSTSAVGGNSNNLLEYNLINGTVAGNTSNVCIYSAGTTANENSNIISNNSIYNYRDRGLDITAAGSTAWTINNNSFYNGDISGTINYAASSVVHTIRILGGAGYAITGNYIGGNAALATGTTATYSSTLGNIAFYGIVLTTTSATPASAIKGNTVAKVTVTSAVPVNNSISFIGIETNGSGITVGGSVAGEGNTIGSNTANGSIAVTTSTTGTTFKSVIRGISCNSSGGSVIGNQVGGLDINNIGSAPASSTVTGIYVNNANAPSQVNNNIIGSTGSGAATNSLRVLSTSTSTSTSVAGITIGASVTSAVQVSGNIIQNVSHQSATASGIVFGITNTSITTSAVTITNNTFMSNSTLATLGSMYGIYNSGTPASITISSNTISSNSTTGTSTTLFGIANAGVTASLSVTSNTFTGNTTTSSAGLFYAIYNSGAVTTTINISSNNIGNSTTGPFTFNAANSGAQIFIYNLAGAATTCALTISNNNFQGINYAVNGTGANTFISNIVPTLSQNISGNTFTNLNIQTSGALTFITNSVIVAGTGTQNINNNSISGTFTKRAGSTVTLLTSATASLANSIINISNNNFSNITLTGATIINGLVNTDAGNSNKIISNNTFINWSCGTSAVTVMTVNITGTNNATTGNIINNITSAGGAIIGITTGAGNDNVYSNTINTLSSTATAVVTGISITAGTVKNIYKNKIYDLLSATSTGTVTGILVSGGATVNVYNNIIGDLKAPAASAADPVRGISVTSAAASSNINVYFNTIYLNATSTGTNFGATGIYHTTSATATTASLTLINNSVTNMSTARGTGFAVAFRRSTGTLTNYNTASNNNLWYAGVPAAGKLIFYDGTASDQTLAAFKTRMSTRDAVSITEDISAKFLSTTGTSGVYLHMNEAIPSLVESGAVNISGITDDFDGQVRQGNTGYTGSGYAPDIGADEIFGIEDVPPTISYTVLTNTTSTSNRTLGSVTITDASGINITSGTKPRIYYKRYTDVNTYADNTSSTNGWKYNEATGSSSPFSFIIDYSKLYGGSAVVAGSIQYFVIAQDLATSANIAINSGALNATTLSVALTAAAFPVTGTINVYNIPFAGNYNVGTGNVFTSLTKADGLFSSINTVGLNGNVTVSVTSDLNEDGTTALQQWSEQGTGNYTLHIQPDGTSLRTASGDAPSGLIRFSGADRVTINGSNGGSGNYLAFNNTNTAGTTGTALSFTNGATYDTIRYCNFEAFANSTNGVILFGSTSGTGNSNNLIDNNAVHGTNGTNHSNTCIYSAGTAGNENSTNTISNNIVYGFKDKGLDITATGSSAWAISNNSFFNGDAAASIDYPPSSAIYAVRLAGGSGYTISNNFIGGNAVQATGTDAAYTSSTGNVSFYGISLNTTSASPASNIKGNIIVKIVVNSVPAAANSVAFTGIETSGSGISIGGSSAGEGNLIGSNSVNGAITINTSTTAASYTSLVRGISCNSSGGVIKGNQVGGVDIKNNGTAPAPSVFNGIYLNNASVPTQVNNNIIGSTGSGAIANNIRVRTTSTATNTFLTGISIGSSVASAITMNANIIQNIGPRSTTASGSFTGIDNAATSSSAIITISNDTIQKVLTVANNTVSTCVFTGIASTSPSIITGNVVDNIILDVSGANAQVIGINVSGNFAQQVSSNTISNLTTTSQKTNVVETGSPALSAVAGIINAATLAGQNVSDNILFNLTSNTTAAVNTVVTGIGITATNSGNIYKNKLYTLTNTASGSAPGIAGITAFGGSFNMYNNSIRLGNSSNTNGVSIYGLIHNAGGVNWNYFHNTIRIFGVASGTALRTAAFIRPAEGVLYLRNNVFVNTRTGPGTHYAISNSVTSPSLTWSPATSDYNDIYSSNANTIAQWGTGTSQTFAQWQTSSGSGAHSVSRPVTFVSSIADLEPDGLSNCALNNAGTPIISPLVINTDINAVSRSATVPDMGAYEFSYTGFTISAGNSSPVCTGSSVDLFSDAGDAFNPAYSWTNPASVVVSTAPGPTVTANAGLYTVTITDENGCYVAAQTTVSTTARPTASISGATTICEGSSVTLTFTVSGSGSIEGTLSSGDLFSGTAPTISLSLSPADTAVYYITDMTDANCASIGSDIHDTLRVAVKHDAEWTGATSTNWNVTTNWYCAVVPVADKNVLIPGSLSRYPVISSGTSAINDLTIRTGASLTISNAVLQIGGNITNSGSITATGGGIEMNGDATQTIPAGLFSTNTLKDLTVNNSAGVILDGSLALTNALIVSNGALATGGYLTLKSTATGVARVAQITSNATTPIGGNVTVERYIPGRRKYRLITSSVTTSASNSLSTGQEALSIWGNWQNQGNSVTGNVGTFITGGTSADGFDTQTPNPSLFTYDDVNRVYVRYSTANGKNTKYSPLKAGAAYYMFVYGDRLNTVGASSPNNTVLKENGTLLTGNQSYTTSSDIPLSNVTGRYTLLGNPFASPIDWATIPKTNLANTYWGWDPNLSVTGGYITVNTSGTVTLIAPFSGTTGLNQYIQPGQGFFVKTSGSSPAMIIREADKTGNFNANAFRPQGIKLPLLAINLQYNSGFSKVLADGVVAAFDDKFSNEVGTEDASKIANSTEGIAIANNGESLSIDARKIPQNDDTLFLNVSKLTKSQYTLQIFAKDMEESNFQPYLADTYLNTLQPLMINDTNRVDFNINSSVAASFDIDRFRIIFKSSVVLPLTFTSVSAVRKNKDVLIKWEVASENNIKKYQLEHSEDGIQFSKISEVLAKGNMTMANYNWLDVDAVPKNNYYRIRALQADGKFLLSKIVVVKLNAANAEIKVFPNPVTDQQIHIQISGLESGKYTILLLNAIGQEITKRLIDNTGESSYQVIKSNKRLPPGVYYIKIENKSISYGEKVFIE